MFNNIVCPVFYRHDPGYGITVLRRKPVNITRPVHRKQLQQQKEKAQEKKTQEEIQEANS